jgi:hypothetical protein
MKFNEMNGTDGFDELVIYEHDFIRWLSKLNKEQQIIVMALRMEYPRNKIADILGVRPTTITNKLSRIKDSYYRYFSYTKQ